MKNSEIGDERLIVQPSPLKNVLDKIVNVTPIEYRFDTSKVKDFTKHYGLIAQEVEKEFPHIVTDSLKVSKHDPVLYKTIDHNQLISVMIAAIKQLNEQVNNIQEQINNDKNG